MAGLERIKVAVKSNDTVLRDPKTMERLTTEGKMVTKTPFWIRRLKAGDCIRLDLEPKAPEPIEDEPNIFDDERLNDGDSI